MGKSAKKAKRKGRDKAASSPASGPPSAREALEPALPALALGDYATARTVIRAQLARDDWSESQRKEAESVLEGIGLDRATLQVGLGCIALLAVIALSMVFTQP